MTLTERQCLIMDLHCTSGRIQVNSTKKNFARGGYDSFFFPKLPYLGSLTQLRVYLDPKALIGSGWALNSVTVTHVATDTTWYFYHNAWVDKKSNFQATIVPIPHSSTTTSASTKSMKSTASSREVDGIKSSTAD